MVTDASSFVSEHISDMSRCENVILESLPHGFKSLKSKAQVLQFRDSDVFEEYKTPVGGSVDIICSQTYQKITVDEVDSDPTDMKLTVMCLPTMKYDIPRENFPKVIRNTSKSGQPRTITCLQCPVFLSV